MEYSARMHSILAKRLSGFLGVLFFINFAYSTNDFLKGANGFVGLLLLVYFLINLAGDVADATED